MPLGAVHAEEDFPREPTSGCPIQYGFALGVPTEHTVVSRGE